MGKAKCILCKKLFLRERNNYAVGSEKWADSIAYCKRCLKIVNETWKNKKNVCACCGRKVTDKEMAGWGFYDIDYKARKVDCVCRKCNKYIRGFMKKHRPKAQRRVK